MKIFIFTILCLSLFSPLRANEGNVLTLAAAIEEALAVNPDIRAAGYRTQAARERIRQAKSLEDPQVGVMFEDVPIDTVDVNRGDAVNYRIEQTIPFPGKRHTRGKAARFDALAIGEENRGRVRDVIFDLKNTYYMIYRFNRSLGVNRDTQALLRQILGSAETSYATGRITADAPLKAQVELSKSKNEEILMEQELKTHRAHLKAILDRHEDPKLPARLRWPRLSLNLDEVIAMALETRPELGRLRNQEKRDRALVTTARETLLPDVSLGFEYNRRPNQKDAWTGTTMLNLPVFFWGKNRSSIREAKAALKSTQAEHESMEIHTRHEIEQAYSAVEAAQKIVASYEKNILPQSRTSLEAARTAYGSGKADFMTLIDAARTDKDLQMSYYDNQSRLGMTHAELERLVGRDL